MNTNLGLIGKKLGNTQLFTDTGSVQRVTVVEAGPCTVLGIRTPEKHGYSALQLGFGAKRTKSVKKPEAGTYAKIGVEPPSTVREFRVPEDVASQYEVGQTLSVTDLFEEGQFVDVSGTSKGRGYTGVMKRHNFAGFKDSHGAHEYKRHGGSIGMAMTPGRVIKGMKMPGQMGNRRVTVLNLRVAKVVPEEGLVLLEGGVPGADGGVVTVRGAVKKSQKAAAQA